MLVLHNARLTLQRVRDARICRGWVRSFGFDAFEASVRFESVVAPDEEFAFHIYGHRVDAKGFARLTGWEAAASPLVRIENGAFLDLQTQVASFERSRMVRLVGACEPARYRVQPFEAVVGDGDSLQTLTVTDVSEDGFGAIGENLTPRNARLPAVVHAAEGLAVGEVVGVYARPQGAPDGRHLLGYRFEPSDRFAANVWRALWRRTLEENRVEYRLNDREIAIDPAAYRVLCGQPVGLALLSAPAIQE